MGESVYIVSSILAGVAFVILVIGMVYFVHAARNRRLMHLKEKQLMHEAHTKDLLARQLEIQQLTMQEIGREIHDSVGQKLTLASLYAQQLSHQNEAPAINHQIEDIGQIINESLQELRSLSRSLIGSSSEQTGDLKALLEVECSRINNTGVCHVLVESNQDTILIPQPKCNILLRIGQEFLQNSLKHAACHHIHISLLQEGKVIMIHAMDDGRGFNIEELTAEKGKGMGLHNMKRRAELIGATLEISSSLDSGTSMKICLNLD